MLEETTLEKHAAVSVIIPVYNKKQGLKRCMDSILAQTYRDFEIIIVDDCSTDATMEYIDSHYGNVADVNIFYIRNDVRLGFGASANLGISSANGDYIAFHNSDIYWPCDKLKKQISFMNEQGSGTDAVYGITEYQRDWGNTYRPQETLSMAYKAGDIYFALLREPMIGLETLLVRKELLFAVGGFTEQICALEDYDLTIRIAKKCPVAFMDEILAVKQEEDCRETAEEKVMDRLAAHIYLMKLYQEDLKKFGMKERKFEAVYEEADFCGKRHLFFQLAPVLLEDPDYVPYIQEKIRLLHPSSNPEPAAAKDISGVLACTGCLACLNRCPADAIHTGYDPEGFLIPVIDTEKCIQCGKCREVCPVCNEIADRGVLLPDDCYAVMGKTQIRRESSSGGVFGMLAEYILKEGGYVAGAVWNDEGQIEHIVSDQMKDVERMRSSKYVQSNMGEICREIETLLQAGKMVLFSGCGCQTAGLKCYLGKDYDNLILVEVVCHGIPSQAVFDSCLCDRDNIGSISFRDKSVFGWNTGLYIRYKDGTEYRSGKNDAYMFGFLNNWTLRKSCYDCKFKNKKYSDILLGDFWGIGQLPDYDDGLGTSFVALNTNKGAKCLEKIRGQFEKIICLRTAYAQQYNMCISNSVKMPACRELFFEQWKKSRDGAAAVAAVKEQLHFDIALIVLWSTNYGNALTNYALYRYLCRQGKSVVILDNYSVRPKDQFGEFAAEHYLLSSMYFPDFQYGMLNHSCETFVVGSDQCWNDRLHEEGWDYFYLDFVSDDRKKVSYAASFGRPEGAAPKKRGQKLFGRFQAVSVREEFGVELFEKSYGIAAQKVVDPVFLLEKEDYEELMENVKTVEEEPFIAAYLLNPTEEKRKFCLSLQKSLGNMKLVNIIDAYKGEEDYNRKILEYDNIRAGLLIEEWLYYMSRSRFIITDSFHGTCFAMIFEKDFITFRARESARFETFMKYPEIGGRILEEGCERDFGKLAEAIDYSKISPFLKAEKERSKQFIADHIL